MNSSRKTSVLALVNGANPVPMRTTTRFPAVKGADWLLELVRTDAAKNRKRKPEWVFILGKGIYFRGEPETGPEEKKWLLTGVMPKGQVKIWAPVGYMQSVKFARN